MAIWYPILKTVIPEMATFLLMASIGVATFGFPTACLLFLVSAALLRLVWNSAILIHGLGHVLVIAAVDKQPSFIKFANLLENRSPVDILNSLIPFKPVFIPCLDSEISPWITAGSNTPQAIRIKSLGGIFFNIIALESVSLLLSPRLDFFIGGDNSIPSTFLSQFLVKAFVGANLLVVFSSLSDIMAFVSGLADCFYCGNFGFLGKRKPEDARELLPKRVVEMFHKMGRETEIRGEQAGGGLTLAQNKDNQVIFIGKKIVNQKRGNLTKSLEAAFAPVRSKAILAGMKSLESTTMGVWHYRYGTSGPPSVLETHWHEWMPAREATVWYIEKGKWICQKKTINHRITHNGDFDTWTLFEKPIENAKLGLWLERVLHTPNATTGDSPKIAGMIDLLMTQGLWYASVRLAYQLTLASSIEEAFGGEKPAKDAPNTAPSELDLSSWAEIFDNAFFVYALSLTQADFIFSTEHINRFEKNILRAIAKDGLLGQWPEQKRVAFVKEAIQAFLYNDLYRATQIFMSRAKGSFGLATVSTLEPQNLVLSAQGQPISIGFNRQEEYAVYASEPTAVDTILSGIPESYRLDLNPKGGEIAWLSVNNVVVYSMAQKRELLDSELKTRWIPMKGNPYIQPSRVDPKDPVESDIKEIPKVLREIERSWTNPSSLNRQSADHLVNLLIEKAKQFQAKRSKILEVGLESQLAQGRIFDLLITGVENSLWLGERFAQDLKILFPRLNVKTLSSNQVLKHLQQDWSCLQLGKDSIVIAISQSGQTFSTVQAINAFDQLCRQGEIGELFIVTGEVSSFLGAAIAQPNLKEKQLSQRIFINGSGRRTAEPATITVAATQQTLTELLFYLVKRMRRTFPDLSPLGLTLDAESLFVLELIKDDFLHQSVVEIVGTFATGEAIPSPIHQKLINGGQKWALHIIETPLAWGIHALYVLITVGWAIPFGYTIPIAKTIFHLILLATHLSERSFLATLLSPIVTLVDIAIYIFGPWLWTLGLRYFQGRQLLARTGKRTLVIGDVPWIHQLLKSYVSKLFSLSYGIASLEVHGANPQDHLLHHFGHRVVRGTLVFLGIPDGRWSEKQKSDENAVIMTGKQASGVRNMGAGPEIVAVGHNPEIGHKGFNDAIILWNNPDSPYENKRNAVEQKDIIEELRESRFGSFERLLASYVFFWALAKRVALFPAIGYQHWKSQSRTKIMTTASPISGANPDLPADEENWGETTSNKSSKVKEQTARADAKL
jgi:hypothetical protein